MHRNTRNPWPRPMFCNFVTKIKRLLKKIIGIKQYSTVYMYSGVLGPAPCGVIFLKVFPKWLQSYKTIVQPNESVCCGTL